MREKIDRSYTEPHWWFAWYPVTTEDTDERVWWERVWRVPWGSIDFVLCYSHYASPEGAKAEGAHDLG